MLKINHSSPFAKTGLTTTNLYGNPNDPVITDRRKDWSERDWLGNGDRTASSWALKEVALSSLNTKEFVTFHKLVDGVWRKFSMPRHQYEQEVAACKIGNKPTE